MTRCMAIRYRDAVADGVTEALVCSLERPADAPHLTDAERSALDMTEELAAAFRDHSRTLTPWGEESIVVR